jgi:hypothetical protein
MFPSREECERLFCSDPTRFLAADVTAGGTITSKAALAYARALGLAGAVLDAEIVEAAFRDGGLDG